MAQKLDFTLPFNDLTQYVPQNLRNPVIKGLIDNLFNRTPPLINYETAPIRTNGALIGGTLGSTSSRGSGFAYDTYGRRFYIGATAKF